MVRTTWIVICVTLFALLGSGCGDRDSGKSDKARADTKAQFKAVDKRLREIEKRLGIKSPPPTRIRFLNKSNRKVKLKNSGSVMMKVRPNPAGTGSNHNVLTTDLDCDVFGNEFSYRAMNLAGSPASGLVEEIQVIVWVQNKAQNNYVAIPVVVVSVNANTGTEESFHDDLIVVVTSDMDHFTVSCYLPYRAKNDDNKVKWKYKSEEMKDVP